MLLASGFVQSEVSRQQRRSQLPFGLGGAQSLNGHADGDVCEFNFAVPPLNCGSASKYGLRCVGHVFGRLCCCRLDWKHRDDLLQTLVSRCCGQQAQCGECGLLLSNVDNDWTSSWCDGRERCAGVEGPA
jgi:hypothetical protein